MAGRSGSTKASEEDVRRYLDLLKRGYSSKQAAERLGFSKSWAYDINRRQREQKIVLKTTEPPEPLVWDQLDGGVKDTLRDFNLFCEVFLARDSVPWRRDAANRIVDMLDGQMKAEDPERLHVVVNVFPGSGKALALDTPLPTPTGWTTVKDVEVGDELFDDSGNPCRVTFKSGVFYDHDCYRVCADDGASVIADADHLWPVRLSPHYTPKPGPSGPKVNPTGINLRTTEDVAKARTKRPRLEIAKPLNLPEADLPIDPYVLGAWLGDGTSSQAAITSNDPEIPEEIRRRGYPCRKRPQKYTYSLSNGSKKGPRSEKLQHKLRVLGVLNNKHVPDIYLRASATQRRELLQGLVDTDGYVAPNGMIEFTATNKRLALATQQLVRSLGVKAGISEGRATIDGRDCGPKWRVTFYMKDAALLPRKAVRCKDGTRTPIRYLTATPVESVPTQCIQVDSPSHLFLAGDGFLITHNTTLFSHDIPAWLICGGGWLDPEVGRSLRVMLGHQSLPVATDYVRRLRNFFGLRNPFQEYDKEKREWRAAEITPAMAFGRFKPKTTAGEESIWRRDQFLVAQAGGKEVYQKEPTVQAAGYKSDFIGNRVNLAMWDDLDDEKSASSIEQSETKSKWRENQAETRVEKAGLFCIVQQRMSTLDQSESALGATYVDEDGEEKKLYKHIVYPDHLEDLCDGDHRQWDGGNDGCLLDANRLSWKDILKARGKEDYLTLYGQQSADPKKVLVHPAWLDGEIDPDGYPAPGCMDRDRGFYEWPPDTNLIDYVTVDPSVANFWAVMWWAVNPETKVRYLIWADRKRLNPGTDEGFLDWDEINHKHVGLMEEMQIKSGNLNHPIRVWIVEQNAAHKYLFRTNAYLTWRQKWPLVTVIDHETHRNKSDKDFGVKALVPMVFKQGTARLPGKHGDLPAVSFMRVYREELTKYPFYRTDDTVMATWFGENRMKRILEEGLRMASYRQPHAGNLPPYLQNRVLSIPTHK